MLCIFPPTAAECPNACKVGVCIDENNKKLRTITTMGYGKVNFNSPTHFHISGNVKINIAIMMGVAHVHLTMSAAACIGDIRTALMGSGVIPMDCLTAFPGAKTEIKNPAPDTANASVNGIAFFFFQIAYATNKNPISILSKAVTKLPPANMKFSKIIIGK